MPRPHKVFANLGIGVILVCLALGTGAWYLVTQPLLADPGLTRVSTSVDEKALQKHVETLANDFLPRDWEHPANLDRAASYIRDQFVNAGGKARYQSYEMEGQSYRNVIATFGSSTLERIIVGAHYDAAEHFPGADDNASGVAGLIELARLLGESNPPIGVELVAFTLEEPKEPGEPGLFRTKFGGSSIHVRSLIQRDVSVRVAIIMDMIGFSQTKNQPKTCRSAS